MGQFDVRDLSFGGVELATSAAQSYPTLRARGFTIPRTQGCFIATFCLSQQHALLHNGRDFDPFDSELGLQVVRPQGNCV